MPVRDTREEEASRARGVRLPPEAARQGPRTQRVLMILLASLLLVIVAFLAVYWLGAGTFTTQPR